MAASRFKSGSASLGGSLLHATPHTYDDGRMYGGDMQRSVLQRLLADVDAGRVDTIVVHKIDRLTRSRTDFARIVDWLEARSASFVGDPGVQHHQLHGAADAERAAVDRPVWA